MVLEIFLFDYMQQWAQGSTLQHVATSTTHL